MTEAGQSVIFTSLTAMIVSWMGIKYKPGQRFDLGHFVGPKGLFSLGSIGIESDEHLKMLEPIIE